MSEIVLTGNMLWSSTFYVSMSSRKFHNRKHTCQYVCWQIIYNMQRKHFIDLYPYLTTRKGAGGENPPSPSRRKMPLVLRELSHWRKRVSGNLERLYCQISNQMGGNPGLKARLQCYLLYKFLQIKKQSLLPCSRCFMKLRHVFFML